MKISIGNNSRWVKICFSNYSGTNSSGISTTWRSVKSVQIRTRKNFVFGHFSRSNVQSWIFIFFHLHWRVNVLYWGINGESKYFKITGCLLIMLCFVLNNFLLVFVICAYIFVTKIFLPEGLSRCNVVTKISLSKELSRYNMRLWNC